MIGDLASLDLTSSQRLALRELRGLLLEQFAVEDVVLFGSYARGKADDESDIDILVVVSEPMTRHERHRITDLITDINAKHGTNISSLVVDRHSWDEGPLSVLPIHDDVLREGVPL